MLALKQVHRTQTKILAQVEGETRVILDEVHIPRERQGLYSPNQNPLKFGKGRTITDDDPYISVREAEINKI